MRSLVLYFVVATLSGGIATASAAADARVTSEDQACAVLKQAAVEYHLSVHDLSGRYYCELVGDNRDLFILGLRYTVKPDELVGSNLIGWFAVQRSDGKVLDWDVNEDRAVPLAPRPPFKE